MSAGQFRRQWLYSPAAQPQYSKFRKVVKFMQKFRIGSLLCGLALMAVAGAAQADTNYSLDLSGFNGGLGTYHVNVASSSPTSWRINQLISNPTSNAGGNPNSDADMVRMWFYDISVAQVLANGGEGSAANASHLIGVAGVPFTPAAAMGFGTGGIDGARTNWSADAGFSGTIEWLGTPGTHVLRDGSNDFAMKAGTYFNLANASALSFAVQVNEQRTYGAVSGVTPEAGSFALLLPGLIPLGIGLRRRAMRNKA